MFHARAGLVFLPVLCLGAVLIAPPGSRLVPSPALASAPVGSSGYGSVPLAFEPNVGQAPAGVWYLAHGPGYVLYLTDRGASLDFSSGRGRTAVVRFLPQGSTASPLLTAAGRRSGIVNYLIGNDPKRWHTNIATFSRVVYHGIYPGIDLVFHGQAGQFAYDWVLRSRANPARISMAIDGERRLSIGRDGELAIAAGAGTLRQTAPRVYQADGNASAPIAGRYRLLPGHRVGFELGQYDHSRPLIIDPLVRVYSYSTLFGAGPSAFATGVAVDASGDAYVSGFSDGAIPTSAGAYQSNARGGTDGFVVKLNPQGSDFIYSTWIGGTLGDFVRGVAVDSAGDAYITGQSRSADFPGGPVSVRAYGYYTFVAKLNPTGSGLIFSHVDAFTVPADAKAVAVDAAGHAYYTGQEVVSNPTPIAEAFVSELDTNESTLHSYQAGGNGGAGGLAISLDGQGNIYVAGWTTSSDFPVANAYQPANHGGDGAFALELNAGWSIVFSTYLGGGSADEAHGIAVDSQGNVYVAAYTSSPDFPTTAPVQGSLAGSVDGFVAELGALGQTLVFSTYLGGHEASVEYLDAIAVDLQGDVLVAGETTATDYPTAGNFARSPGRGDDATVTELAPGGGSLLFSTYVGGSSPDSALGIAADASGAVYVVGHTQSTDFFTSLNARQSTLGAPSSAFVVKFSAPVPPTPTPVTPSVTPVRASTSTATATVTATTTATLTAASIATMTPTWTPTTTSSPTPTATFPVTPPVPPHPCDGYAGPPPAPALSVRPGRVKTGHRVVITVRTQPGDRISVTVKTVFGLLHWRMQLHGVASAAGSWQQPANIDYPFNGAPLRALVTAEVRNCAGETALNSRQLTIYPQPNIPTVSVRPSPVRSGHKLTTHVTADPNVEVDVAIRPAVGTHQGNFLETATGTTNSRGIWIDLLTITATLAKPLKADVWVYATTPGGTSTASHRITILPAG
jgi:hypothetical protein